MCGGHSRLLLQILLLFFSVHLFAFSIFFMSASAYTDADVNPRHDGGDAADNGNSVSETLPHQPHQGLRHNIGLAKQWTSQEQSLLDRLLLEYAGMHSIPKYPKMSEEIHGKSARDVAIRCRWMTRKENGKRRKDEHTSFRRNKDKKEKVADSSVKSSSHSYPADVPYATKAARILNDVGISLKVYPGLIQDNWEVGLLVLVFQIFGIGGLTGQLLEQNTQIFDQISANQASCQVVNNINLFSQIRDNIYTILDSMNDVPEIMNQLPPLYAKLDERLASLFLPPRAHQKS